MAFTTTMRYTGLSGVDTASMVDSMMKAESLKYDALYKKNMTYSYKHEAYQSVGNKLVDIQSTKFDLLAPGSFRNTSSYVGKKSSITDQYGNASNAISVTTGSGSQDFSGTVSVDSLASSDAWSIRGDQVGSTIAANSAGTLNATDGGSFKLTLDGVTKTITYSAADAAEFNSGSTDAKAAVLNRRVAADFAYATSSVSFKADGDDPSKLVMSATSGHSAKITASDTDTTSVAALGFDASTNATVKSAANAKMGEMFWMVPGSTATMQINGKSYSVNYDDSVEDFMKQVNDADPDIKVSYNSNSGNITIASRNTGAANAVNVELGPDLYGTKEKTSNAKDAQVTINGETFYSGTNSFEFGDGTKIKLNGVTSAPLNVDISQDTSKTVSTIHDFIDTYNSMLQAIYDQTETTRPKSSSGAYYQPLTDEERAAMSESDLKKWDENAKQGLLNKDEDLRRIETQLRDAMSKPVTMADGTKISLSEMGITLNTSDISQRGKLSINDDKLNAAIDKYGADNIASAFTAPITATSDGGFAERVDSVLTKSVGMNGTLTKKVGLNSNKMDLVSNDMSRREIQNARALSDMQAKLAKKESWYYKIFSNMETQIQKSNQQLASLG